MAPRAQKKPTPLPEFWRVGRIKAAGPLAAYLLGRGFDNHDDGDLVERIQAFAGDSDVLGLVNDDDFGRVINWIEQAFCVGVAAGQRLQPSAFNTAGGVR